MRISYLLTLSLPEVLPIWVGLTSGARARDARAMPHDTRLIGTIVAGLGVAFLMGALAHRLKISPIAGYLLAGILVGPFTPGFVADTGLAMQLAEIGVILLMFGEIGRAHV